jgi:hypothetical protein
MVKKLFWMLGGLVDLCGGLFIFSSLDLGALCSSLTESSQGKQ